MENGEHLPDETPNEAERLPEVSPIPAEREAPAAVSAPFPEIGPEPDNSEPAELPRKVLRRFEAKGAPLPWRRQLLPLAGLFLCLGCLWGLFTGGQWPDWRPAWFDKPAPNGGIAVVIDPGHGGGDSGAVAQGIVEKSLNLDVGLRVARALRAHGVGVRLTREDDHFVPLEDRVRLANRLPEAIFVSIHFNDASGNGQAIARASGIETYYCDHKLTPLADGQSWMWASLFGGGRKAGARDVQSPAVREGQVLADCIQSSLIAGTAAENRGIKERSLYVTHRVLAPAVLVEGGFVSHPGEARRLGDPAYRQTLADLIASGILKYLKNARPAPVIARAVGA